MPAPVIWTLNVTQFTLLSFRNQFSNRDIFGSICKLASCDPFSHSRREWQLSGSIIITDYLYKHGTEYAWGFPICSLPHLRCFLLRTLPGIICFDFLVFSMKWHGFALCHIIIRFIALIFLALFIISSVRLKLKVELSPNPFVSKTRVLLFVEYLCRFFAVVVQRNMHPYAFAHVSHTNHVSRSPSLVTWRNFLLRRNVWASTGAFKDDWIKRKIELIKVELANIYCAPLGTFTMGRVEAWVTSLWKRASHISRAYGSSRLTCNCLESSS